MYGIHQDTNWVVEQISPFCTRHGIDVNRLLPTIGDGHYIVNSLAKTDIYKYFMLQYIYFGQAYDIALRDVNVQFSFKNRHSQVKLAEFLDEVLLRQQLDHLTSLRPDEALIDHLAALRGPSGKLLFHADFLNYLRHDFRLAPLSVGKSPSGQWEIKNFASWTEASLSETLILNIVNSLYYERLLQRDGLTLDELFESGVPALKEKAEFLRANPGIKVVWFGSRRARFPLWDAVVHLLMEQYLEGGSQVVGTSDVAMSMMTGLPNIGTNAHEIPMVLSAIARDMSELRLVQRQVMEGWEGQYGPDLLTALTDTFTSGAFAHDFFGAPNPLDPEGRPCAATWTATRHDSGDPIYWGRYYIDLYRRHGIDPKTKLNIPSDGLDMATIAKIYSELGRETKLVFGWGTDVTNNFPYRPALSLVVKANYASRAGYHDKVSAVKLSNNSGKTQGDLGRVDQVCQAFEVDLAGIASYDIVY